MHYHGGMCQTIMELNKNKANRGNIPTKSLEAVAKDICSLTDCMNPAILNGVFSEELKEEVWHLFIRKVIIATK